MQLLHQAGLARVPIAFDDDFHCGAKGNGSQGRRGFLAGGASARGTVVPPRQRTSGDPQPPTPPHPHPIRAERRQARRVHPPRRAQGRPRARPKRELPRHTPNATPRAAAHAPARAKTARTRGRGVRGRRPRRRRAAPQAAGVPLDLLLQSTPRASRRCKDLPISPALPVPVTDPASAEPGFLPPSHFENMAADTHRRMLFAWRWATLVSDGNYLLIKGSGFFFKSKLLDRGLPASNPIAHS